MQRRSFTTMHHQSTTHTRAPLRRRPAVIKPGGTAAPASPRREDGHWRHHLHAAHIVAWVRLCGSLLLRHAGDNDGGRGRGGGRRGQGRAAAHAQGGLACPPPHTHRPPPHPTPHTPHTHHSAATQPSAAATQGGLAWPVPPPPGPPHPLADHHGCLHSPQLLQRVCRVLREYVLSWGQAGRSLCCW